jgi:hypothetical protein
MEEWPYDDQQSKGPCRVSRPPRSAVRLLSTSATPRFPWWTASTPPRIDTSPSLSVTDTNPALLPEHSPGGEPTSMARHASCPTRTPFSIHAAPTTGQRRNERSWKRRCGGYRADPPARSERSSPPLIRRSSTGPTSIRHRTPYFLGGNDDYPAENHPVESPFNTSRRRHPPTTPTRCGPWPAEDRVNTLEARYSYRGAFSTRIAADQDTAEARYSVHARRN